MQDAGIDSSGTGRGTVGHCGQANVRARLLLRCIYSAVKDSWDAVTEEDFTVGCMKM
jgi:hypothetical protein